MATPPFFGGGVMSEPSIVTRAEQPYVGIRRRVTMQTIGLVADRIRDIFGWIVAHDVAWDAPFLRYNVIDMERGLEMEAGIPIQSAVDLPTSAPDGELFLGMLPAGRYATVLHVGHPDTLVQATADLLAWASAERLDWDMSLSDRGDVWVSRLEFYQSDPAVEPDLNKWETQLAFKLRD